MNPLAENPFRSRDDLQQAVRDLVRPLDAHTSASGAWVVPGTWCANYSDAGAGLEGFARRLWGLAPLAMGGGAFEGWTRIREGLAAGSDPKHPEYWGDPRGFDVRLVEMASLGVALAMAGPALWDPLSAEQRNTVDRWTTFANTGQMVDNNWKFFCILANLGRDAVGLPVDHAAVDAARERIESMYLDSGWYTDGHTRQRDYYIAFAMHFYALIEAKLSKRLDPKIAGQYRERAAIFAKDFAHWFTADGRALPFGRSLTYRFAQGSFWGALAFADVEALPWGQIKGLLLRHLRWWAKQPIFTEGGVLSAGYAYPNLIMAEQYNAPGSPYWALKAFLPLALPESHPFWQAEEAPLPALDAVRVMAHAGMVVCRDEADDHVVALSTGQWQNTWPMRHSEQKYSKFAYSTAFGFCVHIGQWWADNMLLLSENGRQWMGRVDSIEHRISSDELFSRWSPVDGVEIDTWIRPRGQWHVRVHRVRTNRRLQTVEGGFAADSGPRDLIAGRDTVVAERSAVVHGPESSSAIVDLLGNRSAELSPIEPNVNLLSPRVIAPLLRTTIEPGEHTFAAAFLGTRGRARFDASWNSVPTHGGLPR